MIPLIPAQKVLFLKSKNNPEMPKTYYVIHPSVPGSIEKELEQVLNQILSIRNSGLSPVKINVFADLPDFKSLKPVREKIIDSCTAMTGSVCPAVTLTAHPPEKPYKIVVEAIFIKTGYAVIRGGYFNSIPYLLLEYPEGKELIAGGISSYMYADETRIAAEKAFDLVLGILKRENMSANDIVRQWNYIGNILYVKNNFQNYQIFNEVRSEYYSSYRTLKRYPAATGVGMKHGGVIIDFYAVKYGESVTLTAVDNPDQINAYDYGQKVLKGLADKGKVVKNPPQFERALLMVNNSHSTLFISGTASIIGQETVGIGNVEKQTVVSIENIKKLSDPSRISKLISKTGLPEEKFSLLRVYIKRQRDFRVVRQICEGYFPGVPVTYIEADICRDNLLIEIEGEAEMG